MIKLTPTQSEVLAAMCRLSKEDRPWLDDDAIYDQRVRVKKKPNARSVQGLRRSTTNSLVQLLTIVPTLVERESGEKGWNLWRLTLAGKVTAEVQLGVKVVVNKGTGNGRDPRKTESPGPRPGRHLTRV